MVNSSHDTGNYDCSGYQRDIYDANALYASYIRSMQGSRWKPKVQQFEMNFLTEISQLGHELNDGTYKLSEYSEFTVCERGKTRLIRGEQIRDRVVKHTLCDCVLNPSIKPRLIYDNGASQKGKGISFSRNRLLVHLRKYYREHGNEGYILLMDYSKFYDNIRHDILKESLYPMADDVSKHILDMVLDNSKVDVSYMSDEEYAHCNDVLFNSLEHQKIPKSELTGKKFMHKHMNIGDQVSQTAGIAYPIRLDNYIKIVKGVKYYGRYMDDSYIINPDKQYLKDILAEITEYAAALGITINSKKTRICKLSSYWRYLQTQYSLTETGRVIQKINPKRITVMRRKMKKMCKKMTVKEFDDWYSSWYSNQSKMMSRQQKEQINKLYKTLREDIACIKSH
jgi:hypothetical protein